jgi:hypothetical protein
MDMIVYGAPGAGYRVFNGLGEPVTVSYSTIESAIAAMNHITGSKSICTQCAPGGDYDELEGICSGGPHGEHLG